MQANVLVTELYNIGLSFVEFFISYLICQGRPTDSVIIFQWNLSMFYHHQHFTLYGKILKGTTGTTLQVTYMQQANPVTWAYILSALE